MMKVYNTLSGKKEMLKTRKKDSLDLFVCGPTVYDYSHIGHARTYIAFDIIARYLKETGYDVFYLQNITDIDDKIIQRAEEEKTDPKTLAKKFEKEYLNDMKALKIASVTRYARATDYIKEIIAQIKKLEANGLTYKTGDGIYYDIKKFKGYGKLSHRTVDQAEQGVSRIDESKDKKNKGDFCLWKLSKLNEPGWPSPYGQGRPGWHIEDTAISQKFFGCQYDMHGGARDLIFPHHEAEIAQMEGAYNKSPMVRYWVHTGFLTVKGQKMSKSLGNFVTIQNFLKDHSARTLRFLMAKTHYRSPLNYTESSLDQAERELDRIDEFTERLKKDYLEGPAGLKIPDKQFQKAMDDDFNTPQAVAVLFDMVKNANSLMNDDLFTEEDKDNALEFLKMADRIFNVIFWQEKKNAAPKEVMKLALEREKYRKERDWSEADRIRNKVEKLGWQIEDTDTGPRLKRL